MIQRTLQVKAATCLIGTVCTALVAGCAGQVSDPSVASEGVASGEQEVTSENGLTGINGLTTFNGLNTFNGLSTFNGISTFNGLASANTSAGSSGLMSTASGRTTVSYMVKCALPSGHSIKKQDQAGNWYTYQGSLGVAPEWETGSCGTDCQQQMSACMMAHINTSGEHIALWLDGDSPALGWGQNSNYPFQEGSFFGNLFTSPPQAYYCEGRDFDRGVVHGRLGADQSGAPYKNFGAEGTLCSSLCTAANAQNDGYKSCGSYKHVITVWRDFAPGTLYKMVNRNTNTAADVFNASTGDKGDVVAWQYTGAVNQNWQIYRVNSTSYKIVNQKSGKCLDVDSGRTARMTNVQQFTCNGGINQLWRIVPKGNGYYDVRSELNINTATPMCLDINQNSSTNGANVQIWDCDFMGGLAQQWKIELVTGG